MAIPNPNNLQRPHFQRSHLELGLQHMNSGNIQTLSPQYLTREILIYLLKGKASPSEFLELHNVL